MRLSSAHSVSSDLKGVNVNSAPSPLPMTLAEDEVTAGSGFLTRIFIFSCALWPLPSAVRVIVALPFLPVVRSLNPASLSPGSENVITVSSGPDISTGPLAEADTFTLRMPSSIANTLTGSDTLL